MIKLPRYDEGLPKEKSKEELQADSTLIVADILKAFGIVYYRNDLTGKNNISDGETRAHIVSVRLSENFESTEGLDLYEKKRIKWGKGKHREWNPFRAMYKDGKTYILQINGNQGLFFTISNGVIVKQEAVSSTAVLKDLVK